MISAECDNFTSIFDAGTIEWVAESVELNSSETERSMNDA